MSSYFATKSPTTPTPTTTTAPVQQCTEHLNQISALTEQLQLSRKAFNEQQALSERKEQEICKLKLELDDYR